MVNFHIEPLGKHQDRAAFACGNDELDRYFHSHASQDVRKRVAAAFVLVSNEDGKTVHAASDPSAAFNPFPFSDGRRKGPARFTL